MSGLSQEKKLGPAVEASRRRSRALLVAMDDWQRIKDLCADALERPQEERAAFVTATADGDGELERRVLRLVAAHERAATDFLSAPASGLAEGGASDLAGRRIGAWTVLRELGHGGMGTVYLAARAGGGFEQRAALKVVRGGVPGGRLLDRFETERRILAGLEHPHVARLLDGGATEEGLPYLVMEYVEGEPIHVFCERRKLKVGERIELFLAVCGAVQYAHQNLVVHRDLKPSNILVTEDGTPKLLDFGIAKLLDDPAADATRTRLPLLTPDYASPEQVQGQPVTTASDVYSLGVLLYHLLTGRKPFRTENGSLPELVREISTREPVRPSLVVANAGREPDGAGKGRGSSPRGLRRRLAGDLDAIVLKALRPEPEHRYPSAEALAEDLRRERKGEPVSARHGTVAYRAAKFLRRYRAGVVAALLVAASLVAGILATARQARIAEREHARTERVNAILQRILAAPNAHWYAGGSGRDVTVAQVLEAASGWLGAEAEGLPEIEARVRYTLGTTFASLEIYDAAESELRRSLEAHRAAFGEVHPETAKAASALAGQLTNSGDYAEAEPFYRAVLRICERAGTCDEVLDHLVPGTLWGLGLALRNLGRTTEAEEAVLEALAMQRARGKHADRLTLLMINTLATLEEARGDLAAAAGHCERSLDLAEERPGHAAERADGLLVLGRIRKIQGRFSEAEALLQESAELFRRTSGPESLIVAVCEVQLAHLQALRGNPRAARDLAAATVERLRSKLGDAHQWLIHAHLVLGDVLIKNGELTEAEAALSRAAGALERTAAEDWRLGEARSLLGACLAALGRQAEAEALLSDGLAILERTLGSVDPRTEAAAERLAALGRS